MNFLCSVFIHIFPSGNVPAHVHANNSNRSEKKKQTQNFTAAARTQSNKLVIEIIKATRAKRATTMSNVNCRLLFLIGTND